MDDEAQFCPKCGAKTAVSQSTTEVNDTGSSAPASTKVKNTNQRYWILALVLIICVGGYLLWNHLNTNESASPVSSSRSSSNRSLSSSSEKSKSKSTSEFNPKNDSVKILHYGANKLGNQKYKNDLKQIMSSKTMLVVGSSASDVNGISKKGTGTFYSFGEPEEDRYLGYTVDNDQTVNFYVTMPTKTEFIKSVSLAKIREYADSNDQLAEVKVSTSGTTSSSSSSSSSSTVTSNMTKDTIIQSSDDNLKITNGALAIILYHKYYPDTDSDAPMYLTTDNQGRQEIGYGTAGSDLFYKVNGDTVTVWKIQSDSSKTTANQDYDQSTESVQSLIEASYMNDYQTKSVDELADKLQTNQSIPSSP